jgi:23S rRNA (cytidine1920-2'-O)/16S rRNA (cytidine1409-2'-O)-methyltransferase
MFPVRFDLATVDVSFISLTKILPAVTSCLREDADCIALIKPQFEVGKGEVGPRGIVTDPAAHSRVIKSVTDSLQKLGLTVGIVIESPICGAEGNREFLIRFKSSLQR